MVKEADTDRSAVPVAKDRWNRCQRHDRRRQYALAQQSVDEGALAALELTEHGDIDSPAVESLGDRFESRGYVGQSRATGQVRRPLDDARGIVAGSHQPPFESE